MKKRDIITLVILGVVFLIIVLVILLDNRDNNKNKSEYEKLSLVTNESVFLSVSNNINKICEYSNNGKSLSLIVKDDIEPNEYKNMTFKAESMYVISKLNLYKYYVAGSFYKNIEDQFNDYIKDGYFILNYDIDNLSYNIEVIDEKRYINAKNEEYVFEAINKNKYNKFNYINLNNKSRASLYFNDFLNKIYNNKEEAYELLSSETKNKYFNTYEDFEKYISNYNIVSMKEYSINEDKIGIKDNYGNEYIFKIISVLNYSVTITKTEE